MAYTGMTTQSFTLILMPTIFERDTVNAFCKHAPIEILSTASGPLKGLSFGVKDNYDIAGVPTSFGSPAWLHSHPIPSKTAEFIEPLIHAGALLVGKTHTDELTYSILGMNAHYGTPINFAAPDRVPGGSSSGSAAAVAAGLVDFAIGSDTGGSVRAPASFCGIYGFRPTHGRISLSEARPLAKSFDTLGWFSRDPQILLKVGKVLLKESPQAKDVTFAFLKEAFDLLPPELAAQSKEAITSHLNISEVATVSIGSGELKHWTETFRILQAAEAWQEHGQWVDEHLNEIGPGVRERFEAAKLITNEQVLKAKAEQAEIILAMQKLFMRDTFLILPTVIDIAPKINSSMEQFDAFRKNTFQLLCIAGLCGLPQVTIPLLKIQNAPFGISILGNRGMDLALLSEVAAPK
jgi:amidase